MAKKVLLVDDSKSARIVLSRLLKQHGFEVDMAESGESALEYLEQGRPDAIFIDYMMDGIDGLEAICRIKEDPNISHIPVVMCSANETEDYAVAALAKGAIGILPKPPTKEKLSEMVGLISQPVEAPLVAAVETAEAAMPASPVVTITADEVRRIVQQEASAALAETVEEMVEKALAGRLDQQAQMPSSATDTTALRDEVIAEILPQLHQTIREINDEVVASVIESHFRTQWEEFSSTVNERFKEFHKSLLEELPRSGPVIQSITDIAESAVEASATETASRIAHDIATNIATESTESLLHESMERGNVKAEEMLKTKKQLLGMTYIGITLSLVAIGLVFYFR